MPGAFGDADEATLKAAAQAEPGTDGVDLVATVTCDAPYTVPATEGGRRIVAYDFGIKRTILRHLARLGEVTVLPASTPAAEVLERRPDGVFISNGPGPVAVGYATDAIRALTAGAGSASASATSCSHRSGPRPASWPSGTTGATTRCGGCHRRGRSPARTTTRRRRGLARAGDRVTHVNLNDGGRVIRAPRHRAFGVQYHWRPAQRRHYLFDEFAALIDGRRAERAATTSSRSC